MSDKKPFSPHHVREAFSLTEHELRLWRTALPPFAHIQLKAGQDLGFSYGQLLGFGIITRLVKKIGLSPNQLTEVSAAIFEHCSSTLWEQIARESLRLTIDLENGNATTVGFITGRDRNALTAAPAAVLSLPLGAVIVAVQDYLYHAGFTPIKQQLDLRYLNSVTGAKP
ncbi:MAG TPA: hypothetical protein VF651_05870 [Gammaproteobacteria bacterium]